MPRADRFVCRVLSVPETPARGQNVPEPGTVLSTYGQQISPQKCGLFSFFTACGLFAWQARELDNLP
jgi:hypothetical protein